MPYKKRVEKLNAESVHSVYRYDPATGRLWRKMATGDLKGCKIRSHNKYVVSFNRVQYPATHIIWLLMTGCWPKNVIDHANCDSLDDSWNNLRECTSAQNCYNKSVTSRSASGVKGVFWDKERNKWSTYITKDYKVRFIGRFDTIEAAKAAYDKKAAELFGEFARS